MSTLVSSKHKCTINFLNELHQRYNCGICWHIADEPLSCGSKEGCTGIFCFKCLSFELTARRKCPICQFPISGLPQKNNIIKETIADEHVYCSFAQLPQDENPSKKAKTQLAPRNACQWTGPFKNLDIHLAHNCAFAPVPCTNLGCSIATVRSQLDLHRDRECKFRVSACSYCNCMTRVVDTATHLTTCGKVTLTCTDCNAPYLRENHAAHDLACPEKPITCPFACHGCSYDVLRKQADQHQIDCAVSHSKLLADELASVKVKLSDLAAIKDKIETISVKWTINNISLHRAKNHEDDEDDTNIDIRSKDFEVSGLRGISVLYFCLVIPSTGSIGLYLHKDIHKSTEKCTLCVEGTEITLLHPTDPALHLTFAFGDDIALEASEGWYHGWPDFIGDIKPYITATDSVTFEGQIKCYPDTKATVINL